MQHCQLVGRLVGDGVDHIKGKVEFILVFKTDVGQSALVVLCRFNELVAYEVL